MGKTHQNNDDSGLNDDDIEKMISDATFFFLVSDQKKALIKVRSVSNVVMLKIISSKI